MRSGNSAKRLSTGVPPGIVLTLAISELAPWASTDNKVTPYIRRLFPQSNRRPKCERKSTPMRRHVTSTTTNSDVKSRRNPMLRFRGSDP
jgi:hypothetical protein